MFLSSNTDVQKDIYYHHLSTLFVSEETLLNKLIVRFHSVKIFKGLASILLLLILSFASLSHSTYLSLIRLLTCNIRCSFLQILGGTGEILMMRR